jgi:hypothetical protein
MPDSSKSSGQTKYNPWSSRLGVDCGAKNCSLESLLLQNHGVGQDAHNAVPPVRKKKKSNDIRRNERGRTWKEKNLYNILIGKPDGGRNLGNLIICMTADVDAVKNILFP